MEKDQEQDKGRGKFKLYTLKLRTACQKALVATTSRNKVNWNTIGNRPKISRPNLGTTDRLTNGVSSSRPKGPGNDTSSKRKEDFQNFQDPLPN